MLANAQERIEAGWSQLRSCWAQTGGVWRDGLQARFTREHWSQYEPTLQAFLNELQQLDQVLEQAHRELED